MEGGCACGEVRYRLMSAPMFVNCCHCTSCQTETGSAFVVNAMIEADQVALLNGAPEPVVTPSESGKGQTVWRCPSCRVALWSNYAGAGPGVNFVRVGTLDDSAACPPDAHIFTRSKLPWVVLPEGTPAFEIFYDPATQWSETTKARMEAARGRPA
ncbi:MAG: GFA family protein [Proteobacteria bacterium]|nr:GFA family protein [Pseudomonadota bacterium]